MFPVLLLACAASLARAAPASTGSVHVSTKSNTGCAAGSDTQTVAIGRCIRADTVQAPEPGTVDPNAFKEYAIRKFPMCPTGKPANWVLYEDSTCRREQSRIRTAGADVLGKCEQVKEEFRSAAFSCPGGDDVQTQGDDDDDDDDIVDDASSTVAASDAGAGGGTTSAQDGTTAGRANATVAQDGTTAGGASTTDGSTAAAAAAAGASSTADGAASAAGVVSATGTGASAARATSVSTRGSTGAAALFTAYLPEWAGLAAMAAALV